MRDLFDEVAGKSPLDPNEAVRRTSRAQLPKRFYKQASVAESGGGFAVRLDDRPIKTPSRNALAALGFGPEAGRPPCAVNGEALVAAGGGRAGLAPTDGKR